MVKLNDKVKNTLDEGRILIIGAQVLIGFQFRSVFEPGFEKLSRHSHYLELIGLALMLLALALLIWPGSYHQIVENGEDTERVHEFATSVLAVAVLPFALGFAINFFVAAEFLFGRTQALVAGSTTLLLAVLLWYVLELVEQRRHANEIEEERRMSKKRQQVAGSETKLEDKIQQVLTEVRLALPGAQALLGFQFTALFMDGFQKLPASSKIVHFLSLCFVGLAVILFMTPPAYHRIVERGENTERFHRFASNILLGSLVPLALGVSGDFYVIAQKISESLFLSIILAVVALGIFYGLWFGFTFSKR